MAVDSFRFCTTVFSRAFCACLFYSFLVYLYCMIKNSKKKDEENGE